MLISAGVADVFVTDSGKNIHLTKPLAHTAAADAAEAEKYSLFPRFNKPAVSMPLRVESAALRALIVYRQPAG